MTTATDNSILAAFVIHGDPRKKALQRPRARRQGEHARVYDPPANLSMKDEIKAAALRTCGPFDALCETPLDLHLTAFWPVPASWSRRRRDQALQGLRCPTTRPDLSNVLKAVEDALTGVVYRDDSQLVQITVEKRFDERPRLEVELRHHVNSNETGRLF